MDIIIPQINKLPQPSSYTSVRRHANMQRRCICAHKINSCTCGEASEARRLGTMRNNCPQPKKSKKPQTARGKQQLRYARKRNIVKSMLKFDVKNQSGTQRHRIVNCQSVRAYNADNIKLSVKRTQNEKIGTLHGLQTCGNAWLCPTCSARIMAEKRALVEKIIETMKKRGFVAVMFTLTAQHTRKTVLKDFMHRFDNAFRYLSSGREWRSFMHEFGTVGDGVARYLYRNEITRQNERNGWHYHRHWLVFLKIDAVTPEKLEKLESQLRNRWMNALKRPNARLKAIPKIAFDMRAANENTKNYITKMGLDDKKTRSSAEMTASDQKTSGRTIFDIADEAEHSIYAQRLIAEFANALHNKSILRTGKNLEDWLEIDENDLEVDEIDLIDDETIEELWEMTISDEEWKPVRFFGEQGTLLLIASMNAGTQSDVKKYLKSLEIRQRWWVLDQNNMTEKDIEQLRERIKILRSEAREFEDAVKAAKDHVERDAMHRYLNLTKHDLGRCLEIRSHWIESGVLV